MTSSALVVVLAVAAGISLLRGLVPRLPLPGPLLELICGIVLGPTVLDVVKVDPLLSAVAGRSSPGVVEREHSVGTPRAQRCGWTKSNRSPWSQLVRELP